MYYNKNENNFPELGLFCHWHCQYSFFFEFVFFFRKMEAKVMLAQTWDESMDPTGYWVCINRVLIEDVGKTRWCSSLLDWKILLYETRKTDSSSSSVVYKVQILLLKDNNRNLPTVPLDGEVKLNM